MLFSGNGSSIWGMTILLEEQALIALSLLDKSCLYLLLLILVGYNNYKNTLKASISYSCTVLMKWRFYLILLEICKLSATVASLTRTTLYTHGKTSLRNYTPQIMLESYPRSISHLKTDMENFPWYSGTLIWSYIHVSGTRREWGRVWSIMHGKCTQNHFLN